MCFVSVSAQVGINTIYPIGSFHIDASGNNISITPTDQLLLDDVIFETSTDNEAILGVGGKANNGSQLSLLANNKALGLNKVKLLSPFDLSTIADPEDGVLVFNEGDNLDKGLYYTSDQIWNKLQVNLFAGSSMNFLNLSSANASSKPITREQLMNNNFSVGTRLDFITRDSTKIEILADGAYSFNFQLVGTVSKGTSEYANYYIFLVDADTNKALASYTIVTRPNSSAPQTASVFLNATLKKGANVQIYLCHESTTDRVWTLNSSPAGTIFIERSYMVFWKL